MGFQYLHSQPSDGGGVVKLVSTAAQEYAYALTHRFDRFGSDESAFNQNRRDSKTIYAMSLRKIPIEKSKDMWDKINQHHGSFGNDNQPKLGLDENEMFLLSQLRECDKPRMEESLLGPKQTLVEKLLSKASVSNDEETSTTSLSTSSTP